MEGIHVSRLAQFPSAPLADGVGLTSTLIIFSDFKDIVHQLQYCTFQT